MTNDEQSADGVSEAKSNRQAFQEALKAYYDEMRPAAARHRHPSTDCIPDPQSDMLAKAEVVIAAHVAQRTAQLTAEIARLKLHDRTLLEQDEEHANEIGLLKAELVQAKNRIKELEAAFEPFLVTHNTDGAICLCVRCKLTADTRALLAKVGDLEART